MTRPGLMPVLTVPVEALRGASALAAAHTGPGGYAIAYGSHALPAPAPRTSDLDLLFVHDHPATSCAGLAAAVVALHHREGLTLDTEVRHDVKLCATTEDVDHACALLGFGAPHPHVTPVGDDPAVLNAPPFRLRLFLAALSGPHLFLAGDLAAYRRHTAAADRATAQLALALLDPDAATVNVAQAAGRLLAGPGGACGKDWLGWTAGPALFATLHRGLAALTAAGVLDGPGPRGDYRRTGPPGPPGAVVTGAPTPGADVPRPR